jgi:hypothetical protein
MFFCCVEFSSFFSDMAFMKEWNFCNFEDVEVSEVYLKFSFLRLLCEWSTVLGLSDSGTITEFANLLSFACNFLVAIL